jgi:micrococcal nuclease
MGFDAPELRARCPAEAVLAERAKVRLEVLVASNAWELLPSQGRDKYGRDLVQMLVGGRDVAKIMIEEGLAVEYHGRGPRRDWCNGEKVK